MTPNKPVSKVELRALWGNDDAESTIRISQRQWQKIQAGEKFERSAWGYYEGRRFSVVWSFKDKKVTIHGGDMECIIDDPLENLYLD
jgi:hypothetical protein